MRSIAIIIALAVGASGCAIIAAKSPGPVTANARPDCNSSKGAVVADGLAAATLGIVALALATNDESGPGAGIGLLAAVYTGSAISGSGSADRCRQANDEYDALVQDRLDDLSRQRVADDATQRAGAVDDDGDEPVVTPRVIAPPPVAVVPPPVAVKPPPPAPPTPTMAMRPPAPPAAAGSDDEAADDEAADDADDDIDPRHWAAFWREVKP
jgi:hypothetical protein